VKVKVDYVEVPLFLKARFGGDGVRPYVLAGPYVAFRTKAEGEAAIPSFFANVTIAGGPASGGWR